MLHYGTLLKLVDEMIEQGPFLGRDDWVFSEVDEQNIPVPPTYDEVVAAPKFRNARFQSASHRGKETVYWSLKLRGLYMMYRIWTACNILGIKAEQFRGITRQKDIAFVSDTIFRCVALGLNCRRRTRTAALSPKCAPSI